jgi:outer membrane protein OmpA-like peptidoglycan-associated protein
MQGRVKPTIQVKGVPINDDAGLEREADVMGAEANLKVGRDKQRSRREVVLKAPTNQPIVQRSVTGEAPLPGGGVTAPTKWRVEMTGVAKMTGSGSAQTKPIADTVIFDPGPAKTVTLSGALTFKQYEYGKSWRWGDPKWRRRSMVPPFDYSAYFIGTTMDGTAKVKFSSDTGRKSELAGVTFYEIEPSSSGDIGLIKAKVFYYSNTMEVSTAIKLQPEIKIGPVYIEQEVTIDNFPKSKATVSPQNFKKVEDFWLSLTPETRKAIQDDKMLNNSKVQIIGFTSNTDVVTSNFQLGHKRAMAVRDILMKLSGNGVGTNLAAMSEHERADATDDPKKEHEDAKQRKVKIVLWQLPSPG